MVAFDVKEVLRDPKGERVPQGHFSLLIGVVFQSETRTLREEDLQSYSSAIVHALEAMGGRLARTKTRTISAIEQKQGGCYVGPPLSACFFHQEKAYLTTWTPYSNPAFALVPVFLIQTHAIL